MREDDPASLMRESRASIVRHVRAMLGFKRARRGRLRQRQSDPHPGARRRRRRRLRHPDLHRSLSAPAVCARASARSAGSRSPTTARTSARSTTIVLEAFPDNRIVDQLDRARARHVPFEGLPARIAWLGHGERTSLALAVNDMVRDGELSGTDRLHARSSRRGRDGASEHHDRAHARRSRRDRRLAACSTPWRCAPRRPISSPFIPAAAAIPAT